MKKRLKIEIIPVILFLAMLPGCNSWLDVQPSDRMTEGQVFTTPAGFHSAINGIYTELLSTDLYGGALSFEFIDILAQRYTVKDQKPYYNELINYKYTSDYPKQRLQGIWEAAYKVILNCNKILENAEKKNILKEPDYSLITGEALALRAFLHFDMLRLFGPVLLDNPQGVAIPYTESVGVSASELLIADSVINGKIIRDLDRAEELLRKSDPVLTEGAMAFDEDENNTYKARVLRMNYYAVQALKARVYLYGGNVPMARKYAEMLVGDPEVKAFFPFITHAKIVADSKNPDRVFSTEVLFSLYNPDRNKLFMDYFDPEAASTNLLSVRPTGMEKVFQGEENDYRFYPIWKNSTLPGDYSRMCVKFKKTENTNLFYNYMMPLMRLSELYLIAAECANTEEEGYVYLNILRNNRGLGDVSDRLEARLKSEYIREFAGEGQLFFYYKRKNEFFVESGVTGNGIMMRAGQYLPPLPDSEQKYRD